MKVCDQMRPILLTDYIDNELDENTRRSIDEHLLECHECRAIVDRVRADMFLIAKESLGKKAPPHLWASIAKDIESESRVKNGASDFLKTLRDRLTIPRLAPALVGIILLVLSTSFFLYTRHAGQAARAGEYEYTADMLGSGEFSPDSENEGLGTPIEEYFL